ncbi:nucleotidyltransferase substrate binding protein [Marinilactibacillus psychrotolerans]|uniref:nucleotidyltransferase substrate binding protein n=1 Tax=Marinilactibacillus psychrotolerans TaxID=191770 RepID=UPI0039AEF45F
MNQKEIRWKQRFNNLTLAYNQLNEGMNLYHNRSMSRLEKEGLIQRFEYTFELVWKTLKDYLESEGEFIRSPRETLKVAFQYEILGNGTIWLEMLENRNFLIHTYSEETFEFALNKIINEYFKEICQIYEKLESLSHDA